MSSDDAGAVEAVDDEFDDDDDDFDDDDDDFDDDDDDVFNRRDDVGTAGPSGNRIVGARARDVLEYIAKSLVDDPDAVTIDVIEGRNNDVTLRLRVGPGDMGRVIGRRGRVAQAIRQLVRVAASTEDARASVDIED